MDNSSGDQILLVPKMRPRSAICDDMDSPLFEDKFDSVNYSSAPLPSKSLTNFSLNLEISVKKLKRTLESWREIILAVNSALLWEKQWHPGAIFGAVTTAFLTLWIIDPSVLTTLSVIGLIISIGDYLVPTMTSSIFKNDKWTGAKEKKFEEICRTLVLYYMQLASLCSSFYLMRSVRPKIYYTISIGSLIILAWLGSTVNNLFLTYATLLLILMLPGLEHKGVMCKYSQCFASRIKDFCKTSKPITKTD